MASERIDELNLGYVRDLLDQYLVAPDSVDPAWRELFERGGNGVLSGHPVVERLREISPEHAGNGGAAATAPSRRPEPAVDEELLGGVAAATALVRAYRMHGHLAARLDPLGSEPLGDPALRPENLIPPLTPELQERIPAALLRVAVPGETLADALPHLRELYCGTLAYQIEHISSHEQRVWLRQAIETSRYRQPLTPDEQRRLLARLASVEGFEHYLRRGFLGQKQFSIEGLDVLVPMLDHVLELAAGTGARSVAIGMAHRGRLNVLAQVLNKPLAELLREFEGERALVAATSGSEEGLGDVKYHHGARSVVPTASGEIEVVLASNPSHLEAVDPVTVGGTRAAQTDHSRGAGVHDPRLALAVLVHGDAAFPGQGVVAETFNLKDLPGYTTGGTLHIVANNQVGFTTDPMESRSTRHCSDLAKGFDVPIIHANADDPEAAISAVRLAMAYRERFGTDVVIELVGYRRFGHNEQDEAGYTQPLMVKAIEAHTPAPDLYGQRLAAAGIVPEDEEKRLQTETEQRLKQAHQELRESLESTAPVERPRRPHKGLPTTAVAEDVLRELNEQLLAVPDGFTVHPKLERQLGRRRETLGPDGGVDWGQAEALALASLLVEGIPIRLTGQDTERGTFAHRHLVLHDFQTGERYTPMQHLPAAKASFEVHNSPLSEYAALGFEYGYSVAVPDGLVLWEAQFGDFVNNAQAIVDQFIVSGFAKWDQTSRLTLLLPHGYEGNGPEHSSARVERFLSLAAQGNIRMANCATPAQYFHLLRLQAHGSTPRPLVIFTPKSLLRLRQSTSRIDDLTSGAFMPVFDDPRMTDERRARVKRLVICSGKVYWDIVGHEGFQQEADEVAVARLAQLYPFPVPAYSELVRRYPNIEELVWAQEEPQNMGPFRSIRHRLEESLPPGVKLSYAGRPWRASTSEAYASAHLVEQERLVRAALGLQ